jgi:LPXTG-motif cell wall-anchored protein
VVDGVVKVGDATVVATDIEASNGVIHVIDTVLSLPAAEAAPEAMVEEMPAEAAPAEEMAAPETLPVTGGSSMPSLSVLIGGLALLVLAAAAFVTRRRTA